MKKTALLIMFMIIFTLTSFAQIDVTVEGSAEMTIGINLDDQFDEGDADAVATGITNSTSSTISFSLVSGDSEKGGEADVSGYIKIGGWSAEADSDDGETIVVDAGSVTAQINFPGGWVSITGANNTSLNYVTIVEGEDNEGVETELGNSGGFTIGLDVAPAAIEIGVFSQNDWTNDDDTGEDTAGYWSHNDENGELTDPHIYIPAVAGAADTDDSNATNAYGVSAKVVLSVDPVTVEVAAVMGLTYPETENIGVGAKISADIAPLSIYAATDIQVQTDATLFEAGAGVSADIVDGLSASLDLSFNDVATVGDDLDMKIAITEDGAGGIVPGLGAGLTVCLNNLMNELGWSIDVTLDYTTDMIKPYAGFYIDSAELKKLNIGAEIYAIEMVTFIVDYNTDDLDNSSGIIKLITKISY